MSPLPRSRYWSVSVIKIHSSTGPKWQGSWVAPWSAWIAATSVSCLLKDNSHKTPGAAEASIPSANSSLDFKNNLPRLLLRIHSHALQGRKPPLCLEPPRSALCIRPTTSALLEADTFQHPAESRLTTVLGSGGEGRATFRLGKKGHISKHF